MDEQQIFLPVLEKAETAARIALFGRNIQAVRGRHRTGQRRGDKGLDAVQRIDGDALALAQPGNQLAVVDGAPAEGRFGHVEFTAEPGDLAKNLVVFHGSELVSQGCGPVGSIISPPIKRAALSAGRHSLRTELTIPGSGTA